MLAKSKNLPFEAVMFDLDGTLLDTAPDLIAACSHTLEKFNYTPPKAEVLLKKVTAGMREMLKQGVPEAQWQSAGIDSKMREEFAAYYLSHICVYTKPYPGIEQLLSKLYQQGVKTAVITNKYEHMAKELFSNFTFTQHFSAILGGDSLTHAKPHPEPLLKGMERLEVSPEHTLYIGDHLNDIKAAKAAGCRSCVALWGYGGHECGDPLSWQADFAVTKPSDLLELCGLS